MILVPGSIDLWTWLPPVDGPFLRAVTTNGCVKANGHLVMGRGTALQAMTLYPGLAQRLGTLVKTQGNIVHVLDDLKLVTFPVKHDWRDRADLNLIRRSAEQLRDVLAPWKAVVLPRPGCGYGQRSWEVVGPILGSVLKDLPVYVVER